MLGLTGSMVKDSRSLALTVAVKPGLTTESKLAVTVTVPRFLPVAKPLTVRDRIFVFDEVQVTTSLISCIVPSENVPVAVNCSTVARGMDALAAVTSTELRVALVTVNVAVEEMLPEAAVIVELPCASPMVRPDAPFTLTPATDAFDEVHCT